MANLDLLAAMIGEGLKGYTRGQERRRQWDLEDELARQRALKLKQEMEEADRKKQEFEESKKYWPLQLETTLSEPLRTMQGKFSPASYVQGVRRGMPTTGTLTDYADWLKSRGGGALPVPSAHALGELGWPVPQEVPEYVPETSEMAVARERIGPQASHWSALESQFAPTQYGKMLQAEAALKLPPGTASALYRYYTGKEPPEELPVEVGPGELPSANVASAQAGTTLKTAQTQNIETKTEHIPKEFELKKQATEARIARDRAALDLRRQIFADQRTRDAWRKNIAYARLELSKQKADQPADPLTAGQVLSARKWATDKLLYYQRMRLGLLEDENGDPIEQTPQIKETLKAIKRAEDKTRAILADAESPIPAATGVDTSEVARLLPQYAKSDPPGRGSGRAGNVLSYLMDRGLPLTEARAQAKRLMDKYYWAPYRARRKARKK